MQCQSTKRKMYRFFCLFDKYTTELLMDSCETKLKGQKNIKQRCSYLFTTVFWETVKIYIFWQQGKPTEPVWDLNTVLSQ